MAWQQSDLDAIETAIATGARRVKYADKEVEYNSLSDLLKARDMIRDKLGLNEAGANRIKMSFSKGLE